MKRLTLLILFSLSIIGVTSAQEATEREQKPKRERTPIGGRPDIKGDLFIDFGFNTLNNKPDELRTRFLPSRTFNIYYQGQFNIGENTGLTFNPGIGIGTDKLALRDSLNLFNNPQLNNTRSELRDITEVYGDNIDIHRNNISLTYLDIPIEFRYHFNRRNYNKGVRLAVGGKVGYLLNAQTKVAYTENETRRQIKDRQSYGFERFRYGVHTRLGFSGFNVWGYYGLNNLFTDRGPLETQANQLSFGVSFAFF